MGVDRQECPDCGFEVDQEAEICPLCETDNKANVS